MGVVTSGLLKFLCKAGSEREREGQIVTEERGHGLEEKCSKCGAEDRQLPWCPVTHRQG